MNANPFQLRAGPLLGSQLEVVSFRGRESLSALFSFEIVFLSSLEWNALTPLLLSQPATLTMAVPGGLESSPRHVQGIVAELELLGVRTLGDDVVRQYRMRLVPRMWLLRRKKNSRIFQDVTVVDVVNEVLDDADLARRWTSFGPFPRRAYCLQYEESDYDFIRRLCAEDGIYFYFEPPISPFDGIAGGVAEAIASDVAAVASAVGNVVSGIGAIGEAVTGTAKMVETIVSGTDPSGYLPLEDGALAGAVAGVVTEVFASAAAAIGEVGTFASHVRVPAATLPFVERTGAQVGDVESVHAFSLRRAVRATKAELRDYDFEKPLLHLRGRSSQPPIQLGNLGNGVNLGGAATNVVEGAIDVASDVLAGGNPATAIANAAVSRFAGALEPDLEIYDHRGDYDEQDASESMANVHLEQHRADATVGRGDSTSRRLFPGLRFGLAEHDEDALNREYVVTQVRHVGDTRATGDSQKRALTYENRFRCAPGTVACRPKRRRPRVQQVLETAMVSGPDGEEIHTDAMGRVKVRFHWQRDGRADDHSSCWIRLSQPWAGTNWGFQFIPRVGMEVLVSFVGGDVDRPMILGTSYNGTHPLPFALPVSKTRSGIRTQSTPGGEGNNELSFEDSASKEQVYLHAQRDLDEVVRNDHTLTVTSDETIRIGGHRKDSIGKNATYEVLGQFDETVQGDASVRHLGTRLDVVEKSADQRVGGARTTRLADKDDLEVKGTADHRYLADQTTRVTGNQTWIVGTGDAPRSMTLRVFGTGAISSEGMLELESAEGITLRCGKTTLRIGKDGIELAGGMIRVAGEKGGLEASKDGLKLTSDKVFAQLSDQLLVKTDQASLAMGSEVKIDGQKILLNSPASGKDAPPPERKPPTEIQLADADGNPLPRQRFVLELDDGSQRTGVTDDEGKATLDLPTGGKIRFPELSDVKKG